MAAVAMTTLAITRRKQLPFGETRSQQAKPSPAPAATSAAPPTPPASST